MFWLTTCGASSGALPLTAVSTNPLPPPPPTPQLLPTPQGTLPPTPAFGPTAVLEATAMPQPTETAVPPLTLAAAPGVPEDLRREAEAVAGRLPDQFTWVEQAPADVLLSLEEGQPLAEWVYVLAAAFATVPDDVALPDLMAPSPLFVSEEIEHWPTAVFDRADPRVTFLTNSADLADQAWAERPSLIILPFHKLRPDLKLMRLGDSSPLTPDFEPESYPLTVQINVVGAETAVAQFLAAWDGPTTNWEANKLSRVAMSGVTALTRATAFQMEIGGILTPGQAVGPVFQAADLAHISNEVSFTPDCPYPNPVGGTTFCSRESYFELLTFIGVDVVELTGNHINDWGTDGLLHSLALYEDAGMAVFGGGANVQAAQQPALFDHNGNRIAFLGCNPVGPVYAWAGLEKPGSRPCDDAFAEQIAALTAEGYSVIATLQYNEFYHYAATAQQQLDFAALAEAGAAAVSGSQAHHAQGFTFVDGSFIHYGLGNLFFDQMDQLGTRQSFIDTYVFYDGRLLSVELWTGLIENFCCPRVMTETERQAVLTAVFQASDW